MADGGGDERGRDESAAVKNLKLQIPNPKKAPGSKSQAPEKHQTPNFKKAGEQCGTLRLEAWCCPGAWGASGYCHLANGSYGPARPLSRPQHPLRSSQFRTDPCPLTVRTLLRPGKAALRPGGSIQMLTGAWSLELGACFLRCPFQRDRKST